MEERASRMLRGGGIAAAVISAALMGTAALGTPAQASGPGPSEVRELARSHGLGPLSDVKVPEPPNLKRFVADKQLVKVLGKALFWDEQIGSDRQSCASCHFHAGADNRSKHQLNPGFLVRTQQFPDGDLEFGNSPLSPESLPAGFGPNHQLVSDDFPFHRLADPSDRHSKLLRDTNDVASSQGVFNATFHWAEMPVDAGSLEGGGFGAIFTLSGDGGGVLRNVEPRNTPATVNSVFNLRNFWDGRARKEFNGVSPIGKLDPAARVVWVSKKSPKFLPVNIPMASLASQADGPPLSDLEMSFALRRFADVGRRMLASTTIPLAHQHVHTADSLLGRYSRKNASGSGALGTTFTYSDLVKQAFGSEWWNAPGWVVDVNGAEPRLVKASAPGPGQYTVPEWNFSLYFGVAVGMYETTLVADRTPFDSFMKGDDSALDAAQLAGLDVFIGKGKCVNCHGGAEFTNASVRNAGSEPIERMIMGNNRVAVYDNGFYNIGVRPTREDIGLGASIGPKNLPLADSRRYQDCVEKQVESGRSVDEANTSCGVPRIRASAEEARILLGRAQELAGAPGVPELLASADDALESHSNAGAYAALVEAHALLVAASSSSPAAAEILGDAAKLLPDPTDPGNDPERPYGPRLSPDERVAVDGAFKVPGLRNIAFTAPYFHNGGQATLEQVVEFYNRGGDFNEANRADLDPDIQRLELSADERSQLVAFMRALTDQRVVHDRAPFDHPSLNVSNAGTRWQYSYWQFPGTGVLDDRVELPECGAGGNALPLGTPNTPFANFLDPLQ